MPKWSSYFNNLGGAGPATIQAIKNLGFSLTSEIPGLVAKYVRVDAAQTFTAGEKLQGRTNVGLSEVDNTSDADKPISAATQTALDLKADGDAVAIALALKAPIEDPAFTGAPTAPTAAPGTNTEQIATTEFVQTAVTGAFVFTMEYESAEQVITSGGLLTLAHGFGVAPKMVAPVVICKTAENGFLVGDIIPIPYSVSAAGVVNYGAMIEFSGTANINVRYGAAANVFTTTNRLNGNSTLLTNANWRLIMRAYA